MTEESLFLAARVHPTCLVAGDAWISDSLCMAEEQDLFDVAGQNRRARLSDASRRILDACATTYARWFSVVRECIQRERIRQQLFREEHGLPKSARIPYEYQTLTAAETTMVEFAEDLVRSLFGDAPADYAHTKFQRAISTGDMRAFKIRLLLLKVRDSLHGRPIYKDFIEGLEDCISQAEAQAGCTPDPSPRRLSHRERERKRTRDAKKAAIREQQIELPLVWPDEEKSDTLNGEVNEDLPCADHEYSDREERPGVLLSRVKNTPIRGNSAKHHAISIKNSENENSEIITRVTVTHTVSKKVTSKKPKKIRKCREYETIEQILEDIHEGRITPYESTKEICKDVMAGRITDVEALMFTMALDRYKPTIYSSILTESDMESEFSQSDVDLCETEEVEEDENEESEYSESRERSRSGCSFSYNPRGFCGCGGGHYSNYGADWNTDDEG